MGLFRYLTFIPIYAIIASGEMVRPNFYNQSLSVVSESGLGSLVMSPVIPGIFREFSVHSDLRNSGCD